MSELERRSITGLAIRWVHVIVFLATNLLAIGGMYAALKIQSEQNTKDIQELREHTVDKGRYDEMREDILRRLQRIEDKLDRDRAIRSLH